MPTMKELLEQRVQGFEQLLQRIREEAQQDVNFDRLTELADELGAKADEFAQTLTRARDALVGSLGQEGGEGEGGGEEASEGEGSPPEASAEESEEQGEEGEEESEEPAAEQAGRGGRRGSPAGKA